MLLRILGVRPREIVVKVPESVMVLSSGYEINPRDAKVSISFYLLASHSGDCTSLVRRHSTPGVRVSPPAPSINTYLTLGRSGR